MEINKFSSFSYFTSNHGFIQSLSGEENVRLLFFFCIYSKEKIFFENDYTREGLSRLERLSSVFINSCLRIIF